MAWNALPILAMPTMFLLALAAEPLKAALPKAKTPPLDATSQ